MPKPSLVFTLAIAVLPPVSVTSIVAQEAPPTAVLTHGYQLFGSLPDWPLEMAVTHLGAPNVLIDDLRLVPASVFAAGFESGDTTAWTTSIP